MYNSANILTEFNSIYLNQFNNNGHILTQEQTNLKEFYKLNTDETIAVIAPTSYGKSELIITPSKALLNQTKNKILKQNITWLKKLVIFPEMYSERDKNIVAVLTQERLLRLLKDNPELKFDTVIIDEAHDLFIQDDRNLILSTCMIVLQKRNEKTVYKFLTPFINKPSNLKLKHSSYNIKDFGVNEHLKTEKYYIYDTRAKSGLKIYDQYMNETYDIDFDNNLSYIEFIKRLSKNKNIIYFNRPYDIEKFANNFCSCLEDVDDTEIDKAVYNLSNYFDVNYYLVKCIKKGVIYHHGCMPDNIRIYVENLYTNNKNIKYVITSSTLLEGVNIPASQIFIMDNKKGRGNLRPSDFKNLIGRVCRFGDIFNCSNVDLSKLESNIFLVVNDIYKDNCNIDHFIKNTSKVDKNMEDNLENVLLLNTEINSSNKEELIKSEEFIENYEKGTIKDYNKKLTKTEIGRSCFLNNITEINVFDKEQDLQEIINEYRNNNKIITDTTTLFDALNLIFFENVIDNKYDNLTRFKYAETKKFYKMFLDWKINNTTYKEMISSFVYYWERLKRINDEQPIIYVGSRWGEIERNGYRKLWVNLRNKDHFEIINLAIVKIKEEQDFLENTIIKFIEVLNDLHLLELSFYNKIKYGTDNRDIIYLIQHGLSFYLSREIINNYHSFILIDYDNDNYTISESLVAKMKEDGINDILIFELQQFI